MPVLPSAYNPLIPQPNDELSQSQSDLLNNMGAIQALVDVNHLDFAGSGAGKHWMAGFPPQTVVAGNPPANPNPLAPPYVFATDEFSLYTAITQAPLEVQNDLYIHSTLNGEIPMTNARYNGASGYTYLPSGIILQWGRVAVNVSTAVVFQIPFPNFVFTAYLTPFNVGALTSITTISVDTLTTAGFNATVKSSPAGIINTYFLAIGV